MAKKQYLHILLFTVLIALKISAINVYFHECEDDVDSCEVCEFAIYNQNVEFSSSQEFLSFDLYYIPNFPKVENYYKSVDVKTLFNNKVTFGRPPPSLT